MATGTNDRIHQIRDQILLELYGARPLRLTSTGLVRRLKTAQYDFDRSEVERELDAMVKFGTVDQATSITGEIRYGITAAGILAHENG